MPFLQFLLLHYLAHRARPPWKYPINIQRARQYGYAARSDVNPAFWWIGDSIGMLVITSLLAWLLIPRIRHNNTHAQAFLLLCAGVGLVLFLVSAVGFVERSGSYHLLAEANKLRPWYLPSW